MVLRDVPSAMATDASDQVPVRFSLRTQRFFASLIYRFGGRP